jgi:hypothetical protein
VQTLQKCAEGAVSGSRARHLNTEYRFPLMDDCDNKLSRADRFCPGIADEPSKAPQASRRGTEGRAFKNEFWVRLTRCLATVDGYLVLSVRTAQTTERTRQVSTNGPKARHEPIRISSLRTRFV